jgi:AAHS family 4-hydroxybenzoate transporter-like MFS transporter
MPDASSSNPRPGLEYRVAILCASVLVLEGIDLGAMAFTLPALSEAWHLRPVAFTAALTAGSVGLFLGSLLCGWLGDKVGRKPVLMGCVALFGVMSLATAMVSTTLWLTVFRFITGLGIGGGIPTSIALLSDFSPARRQGGLVMAMTCGVPAGNVLGGIVAARLLAPFGWPAIFVVGGAIPLILLPLLAFLLPESTAFLAARQARTSASPSSPPAKNSIAQLFAPDFARITLLLWLINFLSLLTIYFINSWLPSLLHSLGIATATAILSATLFQVGGIVGGLASGPLVNRYGTEKIVAAMLAMGAGWLVLLGLTNVSTIVLAFFIFGAGLGISAGQLGINALPGAIYPPRIRNTGTGWALGVGRLGNIAGPLFGGILLALGWPPKHMLLAISVPAFLLAAMLLLLAKTRGSAQSATLPDALASSPAAK